MPLIMSLIWYALPYATPGTMRIRLVSSIRNPVRTIQLFCDDGITTLTSQPEDNTTIMMLPTWDIFL